MTIASKTRSLAAALAGVLLFWGGACAHAALVVGGTPRFAHSAALMANGNILIAGGVDQTGAVQNSAEIRLTANGGGLVAAAAMSFARSSHTATFMANGKILVAGGWDGANIRCDAEVYDSIANSWALVTGGGVGGCGVGAMQNARYNHTATLLNDGRVLVCGGQNTGVSASATCDFFTPTGLNGCVAAGGCFSAAPPMQLARALHTSVLLKDGKVWVAGGWNPTLVVPAGYGKFTNTTEAFDPTSNAFNSANPLNEARAYHTATMMGDGKVLIAGGYNGRNDPTMNGSLGILQTMEIFDPVGNTTTQAAPMSARREQHSAVLNASGRVQLIGGLGNVTTTYVTAPTWLISSGTLATSFTPLTGGVIDPLNTSATVQVNLTLGQPVSGVISKGRILYGDPITLTLKSGKATLVSSTNGGIYSDLSGAPVIGGSLGAALPLLNSTGTVSFTSLASVAVAFTGNPAGTLGWTGSLTSVNTPLPLLPASSSLKGFMTINFPVDLAGAKVVAGTITINTGSLTEASSYTVTFNGGQIFIPAGTVIGGNGITGFTATAVQLAGTVAWAGADPAQSIPGTPARNVPEPFSGSLNTNFNGSLDFVASGINLANPLFPVSFSVGVATVQVSYMAFADSEYYAPQQNQTSISQSILIYDPQTPVTMFGTTATLMPNDDTVIIGGVGCHYNGPIPTPCQSFPPNHLAGLRLDQTTLVTPNNFSQSGINNNLAQARAFHTSTLLPDQTILVAGGTNGPNVLNTGEVFNTLTGQFSPTTSGMRDARDLHTATLLPDGRVLIAGGFTTSAVSTGSTSGAEVYYPDTKIFVPTSSMTFARSNHTATLMPDGSVIAAGGFGVNDVITNTVEVYYSTSMTWGSLPNMGAARTLHSATLLKDGRLMLAGGQGPSGPLNTAVAYNPKTNAWSALANLLTGVYAHTATLLFDGRVLVTGGNDGFGESNTSQVYDPNTDSWSNTGGTYPMTKARFNHSALLLPNGEVMITGGQQRFGVVLQNAEFFHVNASSWTPGASLDNFTLGPRAFHTMTLAPNGRIYAIGGANGAIGGNGSTLYSAAEAAYFTEDPDSLSKNAPPSIRKSTITSTSPFPFKENTPLSVWGLQFRGGTEAAGGGAASANSSFSFPHLILQQIDGSGGGGTQSNSGFVVDLTTAIYLNPTNLTTLNSSVTVQLPATNAQIPYGWYNVRTGANDIYSDGYYVQVGPAKPTLAPASAAGAVLGTSSISWTWGAVADPAIVGFNVYQATSGVFLGTAPIVSPLFVQQGLSADTTASILVAGYSLSGDGPLGASATNYTLCNPPAGVMIASVTFTSLLLEWTSSGNTQGTIYEVYMSTDIIPFSASASTPVTTLQGLTATQIPIGQLQANTTYSFRLRAFNGALQPSNFSVTVTTLTRVLVGGLVGTAISSQAVQWNWLDPGGVSFFKIYDSHTGLLISTTAVSVFNDVNLPINSLRSVNVTAVTGAGEGPLSGGATVFTLAATPIPNSPSVVGLTTASFTTSWSGNNNPTTTRYILNVFDFSISSNGVLFSQNNTINTGAFAASPNNLTPGTYVLVQLSAANGQGILTPPIVLASTWTLATQPANLRVLGTTPVSITVQWDPQLSTSTFYQLTYSTDNFATSIATAIAFSAGFTGSSTTLSGLITSQQYWFRVRASNPFGQLTQFSAIATTITTNGGAALGSLQGTLTANGQSEIAGNLGNGRAIDVRSPNGAFTSNVVLAISSFDAAATPLCPNGINVAFSFQENPALQPIHPIFVSFSYTDPELGLFSPSQLVLERFEPTTASCIPLSTTVDPASHLFTAQINHFSLYQLAAPPPATSLGNARIFPNPYRAARDAYVTIDTLPPAARVRVMTLRGETVFDQNANANGLLIWSATNGAGRALASGLYLVVIEASGTKKILKLAVVR